MKEIQTTDYIAAHIGGEAIMNRGRILDTRELVKDKIEELKIRVNKLKTRPKLVIIRVGNDFASGKYVANKIKRCEEVGMESEIIHLHENVSQSDVAHRIKVLNDNAWTTGVLLQLPLPKTLEEDYLTSLIDPEKDVDGFTTENMGRLILNHEKNVACTPKGIMTLLNENNIEVAGKDVLIINRSNIVGKPLAMMLMKEDATITIAHSKTKNLMNKILSADIIITGVGKANFLNADNFRNGQVVIDVSINFDENGKMCGDIRKSDYDKLIKKGVTFTPVPFGVGGVTVLSLIEQTIEIAERNANK